MALYERLQKAYITQVVENQTFVAGNLNISEQIAATLRQFLDLPLYNIEQSGSAQALLYLRIDHEKGYVVAEDLDSAVTHFPEGKFNFGLGILLQANDPPKSKQFANFSFSCDRTGDALNINVLDQSFEMAFNSSDSLDLASMCQHIFDDLLGGLNWRISDEIEKTRVGFDVTPVED